MQYSGSGGCPCTCNYATDPGCTCRNLKDTLNVTITKGAVYSSYPLIYQQAFNYRPTEVQHPDTSFFALLCILIFLNITSSSRISMAMQTGVLLAQAIIRTGANFPISSCDDDPLGNNPTCGWATDATGNRLLASQGFCCSCTASALAAATLGTGTNQCMPSSPQP